MAQLSYWFVLGLKIRHQFFKHTEEALLPVLLGKERKISNNVDLDIKKVHVYMYIGLE